MDIGHLRHTRWVKNDDPQAQINNKPELTANGKPAAQNRWIAYNKMRGQYASAMEPVGQGALPATPAKAGTIPKTRSSQAISQKIPTQKQQFPIAKSTSH